MDDHTLVIPALHELQRMPAAARSAEVRLIDQVGSRRPAPPSRRGPLLIAGALALVAALAAGASSAALRAAHGHAKADPTTAAARPAGAAITSVEADPALARAAVQAVDAAATPATAAGPAPAARRPVEPAPQAAAPVAARVAPAAGPAATGAPDTAELDDEPSGGLVPAPAHLLDKGLGAD